MLEIITNSGAVIRGDNSNPKQAAMLDIAIAALGGAVLITSVDEDQHAVLAIMDQKVIGTTLTDADSTIYTLDTDSCWYSELGEKVDVPPFETIVSATMPGGWSWNA